MAMDDVFGCPHCQAPLTAGSRPSKLWRCNGCGQRFAQEGQIPALIRREDAERFSAFGEAYRQARLQEGWQPLAPEQALTLPGGQPPGYPSLYWQVRRQSFAALMGFLARWGPSPAHGPAADVGAGIGWLSYRLAQLGYRVLAVDASLDPDFGLGAAERLYRPHVSMGLAQGGLEHPPLREGALSLIVLNASLHYVVELQGTLSRNARALRPGGRLVILDTPISRQPRPGTGRGDRHLGQRELQAALQSAGLSARWIGVPRDWAWGLHQLNAWLRRAPRFSFPLIVAERLS
ncbi:MAG: class I SAM-dependent methyltransferase [Anaerolineae bacterium]